MAWSWRIILPVNSLIWVNGRCRRQTPADIVTHHHRARVPENHPSPDAGYSVDILHPILEYTPIFTFTREAGFTLTSDNRGTLPPSVPITLPLDFARRRQLRDTAGSSSDNSLSRTAERGPSFPSRVAVRAGLLRSVSKWGQEVPDSTITGTPRLQGQFLTAPSFTLQAGRSDRAAEGEVEIGQNGGSQAQTRRDGANIFYQNRLPSPQALQPDIILGNIGGNQLFRAFLEGVGAALPSAMRNTLFGDRTNEEEHDFFYPIRGPHLQHSPPVTRMNGPVFACSLKGLWVGCYAAHGYEFGSIVMRNVWTRIHTADEVALEQIYDNDDDEWQEDGTNAELGVVRETLAANLEGSIKRRRSILEFIKITGDTNVPAGQVSWVAVLPSEEDEDNINQSDAHRYANNDQVEPDLDKRLLPSILREDWENWSDIPPSTTRRNHGFNVPRWNEGSVQAAGRIAFNGFVDTRFIDAQATFVREKSGEVDEVRIRWCGAALSRAFLGKS